MAGAQVGAPRGVAVAKVKKPKKAKHPRFKKPFPKVFTSINHATTLGADKEGDAIQCSSEKTNGQITSASGGTATMVFQGCLGHLVGTSSVPCTTPGDPPGTVSTAVLSAALGYVNRAMKLVGWTSRRKRAPSRNSTARRSSCG
jgi:hypothetical protein